MDPRCLQYWRDGDVLEMVGSSPPGVLDSRAAALQFGHRECGVHRCCTSVPDKFWPSVSYRCVWSVCIRYAIKRPGGAGVRPAHISTIKFVPRDNPQPSERTLFDRTPIAIARNATLDSMARRVQHAFRRCVTDPGFAACRRRLVREFEGLARGET